MNRIKINGEWYVKESAEPQEFDILSYEALEIDADGFRLEGVKLKVSDGKYAVYITVKQGDTDEHWDNEDFIKGLADGEEESWKEISDLNNDMLEAIKAIVNEMRNKKWI